MTDAELLRAAADQLTYLAGFYAGVATGQHGSEWVAVNQQTWRDLAANLRRLADIYDQHPGRDA